MQHSVICTMASSPSESYNEVSMYADGSVLQTGMLIHMKEYVRMAADQACQSSAAALMMDRFRHAVPPVMLFKLAYKTLGARLAYLVPNYPDLASTAAASATCTPLQADTSVISSFSYASHISSNAMTP